MNIYDRTVDAIDNFQRRHKSLGFPLAVIKRYNEDKTGFQAALLTYYAFLALSPLLLIGTTLATIIATQAPEARAAITTSLSTYFPAFSDQLNQRITSIHRSNLPIIIGLVIALYGTKGVVEVFRRGVRSIWHEKIDVYEGFPRGPIKGIGIVFVGGLGLLSASILAGYAAAAGHGILFRLLSLSINLTILFAVFTYLLNTCLPKHVPFKQIRAGGIAAAIGLVLMQTLGGYVLTRELRTLDAVYSIFAISLGLLFWIYLQAQVLYYSATIVVVKSNKLWPRALTDRNLTAADKRVLKETL